jgi:hypothetical protein
MKSEMPMALEAYAADAAARRMRTDFGKLAEHRPLPPDIRRRPSRLRAKLEAQKK